MVLHGVFSELQPHRIALMMVELSMRFTYFGRSELGLKVLGTAEFIPLLTCCYGSCWVSVFSIIDCHRELLGLLDTRLIPPGVSESAAKSAHFSFKFDSVLGAFGLYSSRSILFWKNRRCVPIWFFHRSSTYPSNCPCRSTCCPRRPFSCGANNG